MFKTHAAFGFFLCLLFLKYFPQRYPFLFLILVTFFSALPDIDTPKSKIGRKLPFISIPLSFFVKHRGITHSIFPIIGLYILFDYFNLGYLALAIALGYFTHLIGDGVSKEGVNFLYPLTTLHLRGFFKVGGKTESIILIALIILNIFFFFNHFKFF